ncbi:MAG: M23 family metallopeptidase, partial [bacterium]|nr:M23 family metallopeptidase [bacterium]
PGDGEVVRVVDHLEDNPIHEVNTTHCWGNLVILRHTGGWCSALCHLQKGSVTVGEGAAVTAGQLLGRVGNSGRSPVPHLHYQLQLSAEVGAAACYCELIHYLTPDEHGSRYVTRGVPAEGQSVMAMAVEEAVRDAASLAPGRRWQWTVVEAGRRRQEAWHSEIDPLGRRRLVDASGEAEATFFADRHHLAVVDYRGRPNRLLGLLYLGMPRLPYLGNGQVGWSDRPAVTAFMSRPIRWVDELALPFRRLSTVRTSSRCRSGPGGRIEVVTELSPAGRRLPDRIEIELAPQTGPRALRSFQGDRLVLSATCGSLTYLGPKPPDALVRCGFFGG